MIDFFVPTEPFGEQTQRLAAEAACSAADIFEIEGVCRALEPGDGTGWDHAWLSLAEAAEQKADDAERDGRYASAIMRFWHAASYYRQSAAFFECGDARRTERFRHAQASFRRAARLLHPAMRVVQVPCGEESYDGYFCLPHGLRAGEKVPACVLVGGVDSYSEEDFFSGRAMLERGVAMLLVDTPGHGSSLYVKNIPARPDYEVPLAAAIDWLVGRPEVDVDSIGLVGIGLGAYYASRGAAFDTRVKALACWSGIFSVLHDLYEFCPRMQSQLRCITGAGSDVEARMKLARFQLDDAARDIKRPTMILHGRNDQVMDVGGAQRFFEALGAQDKQLHIMDGAGSGHCNYGDWRGAVPLMFDWLSEKLGVTRGLYTPTGSGRSFGNR